MPKPSGKSDTRRRNGNGNFGVVRGPPASDHKILRRHESEAIFRQSGVKPDTIPGPPMTPLNKQLQPGRQNPHKGSTYDKTSVRRSDLAPVFRYVSLVKPDTFSPLPEKMAQYNGRPRRLSQPHTQRPVQ